MISNAGLPGRTTDSDDEEMGTKNGVEMLEKADTEDSEAPITAQKRWTLLATEVQQAKLEDDDVKMERLIKLFQREVNKGFIFKELIPYCMFLLFMILIVMLSRSEQHEAKVHRSVDGLKSNLISNNMDMTPDLQFKKTFWDISTEGDWWRWLETPYLSNIWPDPDQNLSLINRVNKPLGFIVLRQLRVSPKNCSRNEGYHAVSREVQPHLPKLCYDDYYCNVGGCSLTDISYGPGGIFKPLKSTENNELQPPSVSGRYAVYSHSSYSYVELIPLDDETYGLAAAKEQIKNLRTSNWIDESTRFLAAEIITLNRNYDLFVFLSCFIEINGGGLWHPDVRIIPYTFLSVTSAKGIAVFILDLIVTVYFLYIFYRLIQALVRNWKLHGEILSFFAFWNTYALGDMILFMVTYGYRWYFWHETLQLDTDKFPASSREETARMWSDLARFALLYETSWNCYGFACALAIGGLFRFTQYNPRLFLLVETVERALGELISVVAMMTIIIFAYGILGHLLFGYYLDEYQSFMAACGTLLRHLIGDFPESAYFSLRDAQNNSYIAVIYLTSYTFIAWCILLNMILAIINESLAAVKTKAGQKDIAIMKWLQARSNKLVEKCTKGTAHTEEAALQKERLKEKLKQQQLVMNSVYEKLKLFKSSGRFREKLMKKTLRNRVDWSDEEWAFLEEFMEDRKAEVFDREADTPERQKLDTIAHQIQQIQTILQEQNAAAVAAVQRRRQSVSVSLTSPQK